MSRTQMGTIFVLTMIVKTYKMFKNCPVLVIFTNCKNNNEIKGATKTPWCERCLPQFLNSAGFVYIIRSAKY